MQHLDIMVEPYLSLLLNGTKKIETRMTQNKIAPYKKVEKGDLVYFKKSGGMVVAKGIVKDVMYFNPLRYFFEKIHISKAIFIQKLFDDWNDLICATKEYIKSKLNSNYITCIWFESIERIEPIVWKQKGQLNWIVDWRV